MGIGGRERAGAAREKEKTSCADEREKRKKVDVGFSRPFLFSFFSWKPTAPPLLPLSFVF